MRLVKIKNKYLFKSSNPEGTHTYAVYKDRDSNEIRAIQLTHLYTKDEKRFVQVRNGNILVEKFKEFDVPSGVRNQYYNRDVNGNKINLKNNNVFKNSNRFLKHDQAERIRKFAKYKHK